MNIKYSRQREAIKNFLINTDTHPTAEDVYNNVKKEFPNISLGTVYRNLSLLADLGVISKLTCGDTAEHFDGNTCPHYHFICAKCNSVTDLEIDYKISNINSLVDKEFKGDIEGHSVYFYGTCENCKKN